MIARSQRKNARHCHAAGMTDAEPPSGHSQRRGGPRRAAGEPDFRRRARCTVNHHVGKRNAPAEARAERLEDCFLGGKPACQALDPIDTIADLIKFGLNKAARDQRVARIVDPAPQLGDLDDVDSMSDYTHACQRAPDCAASIVEPFLQLCFPLL